MQAVSCLGIGAHPTGPTTEAWFAYLDEQDANRDQYQNPYYDSTFHQCAPVYNPPMPDSVSMPANTLEAIICAVGLPS